jgi:hypothetical protein
VTVDAVTVDAVTVDAVVVERVRRRITTMWPHLSARQRRLLPGG